MKTLAILIWSIVVVAADMWSDDSQASGSSISGSITLAGFSSLFLKDILEDNQNNLLYFVGYFYSASPLMTFVYKSDHNLSKLKVMTYDINLEASSLAIDSNGDFIYIQDKATGKIFEIKTSDMLISRELSITSASIGIEWNMEVGKSFYFSVKLSGVIETCRWDRSSTSISWFSFGVFSRTNLAPISDELLFIGSIDTTGDQYYLINYNFSDPSNLVWKKSINCLTTGCASKMSGSLISRDEKWIYSMILFHSNFIFQKLSVADGTPQNSGFIWNDSGYDSGYSLKEFYNYVAIQIYSGSLTKRKKLILVNIANTQILKEYESIDSRSYAVGRLLYQGEELMYHCGRHEPNYAFFIARSSTNNIDQLQEFQEETPVFTQITSTYQVAATSSIPSLTSSTKTLGISTSSSITTYDNTSAINPVFKTYVALWNEDHIQSVQSNTSVQLNFTWAWAQAGNFTTISFNLVQTGTNEIPEWVQIDVGGQELYLNKTPRLSEAKTFYFSLQISFNSEVHYKKFEITVEQCNIENCEICQLGNPNLWETCKTDYKGSDGQKTCSIVTAMDGAKEAASFLVILGVVFATASSILSVSSLNSIFSVMNSMQLVILLPLIPDYISPIVLDLLGGVGFTMLSFDFIKLRDLPFADTVSEWASYPQPHEYLNSLGLRSGSSAANNLSLFATCVLLGIVHFWIFLLKKWTESSNNRKCSKFTENIFKFFTFNIYIRIFIQAFSFTSLSIFSELYDCNLDSTLNQVSFVLWILYAMGASVLFLLSFYMYFKSLPQFDKEKYWPWVEYFNGVKPTKYAKLYSWMFMTLRVLLCSLLIFGKSTSSFYKAIGFSFMNIVYWLYLIAIRPFENPQNSVIEIINQTLFCCLTVPLCWLNSAKSWTSFYETFYTSIFTISPAIWAAIGLMFLLKAFCSYIIRRKTKKPGINVTPKKPSIERTRPQHEEQKQSINSSISKVPINMHRNNVPIDPPVNNKLTKRTPGRPTKVRVKGLG